MTLIDVVKELRSLDDEMTIYAAEPWTENSKAVVAQEPSSGGLPLEAERLGLTYFLEVFIASEFLDDWAANRSEDLSLQEKCAGLIEYAINDA